MGDSLDVYHHVINGMTVRMIKLSEIGLDMWQTVLAVLLITVGILTFYVVPMVYKRGAGGERERDRERERVWCVRERKRDGRKRQTQPRYRKEERTSSKFEKRSFSNSHTARREEVRVSDKKRYKENE